MTTAQKAEKRIRILIVDDHVLMRIGLTYSLNQQPDFEVAGEAGDGAAALRVYRECRPDVVILDLRMPGEGGLETIRRMRRDFRDARILVLTNYGSGDEIEGAIRAGALGFLPKDSPLEELAGAIRDVAAGSQHIASAASARLANRIASQLSDRELEILRLIAKGRSNKEVAAALQIAEPTVKGHVTKLLLKLGVADRTQALVAGFKRGLIHLE